jgi:hypothetical protein
MSSKVASANTGDTAIERDGIADFFANNKLNLGDKLKGNVYTGVVAGRGNSDQELVRDEEVIYVSTEMKVENRSRSSNSDMTWHESISKAERVESGVRTE